MTKILGIFAASALSLGVLAGCGSGGEAATEPTPEVSVSEAASPSPVSAVDTYCQQVEDYEAQYDEADEQTQQSLGADLQKSASELTQELMDDPEQAARVQECTTKLQEVLAR